MTSESDDGFRARDTWYDIPEGSIPDMKCGGARNGEIYHPGVQDFRPQDSVPGSGGLRIWRGSRVVINESW